MKIQDDIIQEIKNMEKMFPGIFFEYFEENSANLHYIFVSDKNIFENEEFAKLRRNCEALAPSRVKSNSS